MKNGGAHFLAEIASREFMESLVSLLKAIGPASVNAEVRAKILELIQSWATATEGRYELGYIGEVYRTLQREGFQFPPRVSVASSMIDSSAVRVASPELALRMLTLLSPPSGLTQMFVCDAGLHSLSPTESIIVVTAETASTSSAQARRFPFPTSVSSRRCGSTMGVMQSSQTSLLEVA